MITLPKNFELRRWVVVDENGCWLWLSPMNQRPIKRCPGCNIVIFRGAGGAYPTVSVPRGQSRFAYTWVLRLFEKVIPLGMVPDHTCDNSWCVNPDHLEPVTIAENVGRANKRRAERNGLAKGSEARREPAGGEENPVTGTDMGGEGPGGRDEPAGGSVRGSDGRTADFDDRQCERVNGADWDTPPCLLGQ